MKALSLVLTVAAWEAEARAAMCPVEFTFEDMAQHAAAFIKTTVPARFKAWAESLGEAQ